MATMRYIAADVPAAAAFHVDHLGFEAGPVTDGCAIVQGNGGRQALVEEPSGNVVELFESKA